MSQSARVLALLLLLALLPSLFPPAAVHADEPIWRGDIVHAYTLDAKGTILPPTSFHPATAWSQRVVFQQKIYMNSFGNAAFSSYTYEETYEETQWLKVNQPQECLGKKTLRFTHYETGPSLPASITVESDRLYLTFPPHSINPTRNIVLNDCWQAWGPPVTNGPKALAEYLRPWYYDPNAVSDDGLSIIGRDTWPGRNWDHPPFGPNSRQTVFTSYNLTRANADTPWLPPEVKQYAAYQWLIDTSVATVLGPVSDLCSHLRRCAGASRYVDLANVLAQLGALGYGELAKDPPDPNYTEIAVPVTPTTHLQPVMPDEDISPALAAALNAYAESMQRSIGLARAMLTSFDRASGAQAGNNNFWVNKQLEAARLYSGQLADELEARPQLLTHLQQAFAEIEGLPFAITADDLSKYHHQLVTQGLPAEHSSLLAEMGADAWDQEKILNGLLETLIAPGALPTDTVATFPDLLTDPELIVSTQALADALRAFSQSDPGFRVYLPMVVR